MIVSLKPVLALVAIFIWLGLSAREFDKSTRRRLLLLIAAIVLLNYVGVLS